MDLYGRYSSLRFKCANAIERVPFSDSPRPNIVYRTYQCALLQRILKGSLPTTPQAAQHQGSHLHHTDSSVLIGACPKEQAASPAFQKS